MFDPDNPRWKNLTLPAYGQQVSVIGDIVDHRPGSYLLVSPFIYNGNNNRPLPQTPSQSSTGAQYTPGSGSSVMEIPVVSRVRTEPESPTPQGGETEQSSGGVGGASDVEELEEVLNGGEEERPAKKAKRQTKSRVAK